MRQRSKIAKVGLQFAAIVFFFNAMAAYGICCNVLAATDMSADVEMEMPCNQTEVESDDASHLDDCCLTCVPMMTSIDARISNLSATEAPSAKTVSGLATGGIDPPFRPPIPSFS